MLDLKGEPFIRQIALGKTEHIIDLKFLASHELINDGKKYDMGIACLLTRHDSEYWVYYGILHPLVSRNTIDEIVTIACYHKQINPILSVESARAKFEEVIKYADNYIPEIEGLLNEQTKIYS